MRAYAKTVLVTMIALVCALPALGQVNGSCPRCPQVQRQPYMAEFKITHVQTLPDGTTITRETKEITAVDSQGRRLNSNSQPFPINPENSLQLFTNVNDPVENTQVSWDSRSKTARVIKFPPQDERHGCWSNENGTYSANYGPARPNQLATQLDAKLGPGVVVGTGATVSSGVAAAESGSGNITSSFSTAVAMPSAGTTPRVAPNRPVREELGSDVIMGVEVHGYRMTSTIPVGQIGNDRPIVTTSETWTAPSLGGIVLRSVNESPQNGKQTREVVSLAVGDPDPSVFQPPEGYKVTVEELHEVPCAQQQ
jgi:hypothetical protein